MVGFADPSNMPHAAGWPLRNLLALAHQCWGVCRLKVLCYRAAKGSETAVADMSRLLVTELPHQTFYDATQEGKPFLEKRLYIYLCFWPFVDMI